MSHNQTGSPPSFLHHVAAPLFINTACVLALAPLQKEASWFYQKISPGTDQGTSPRATYGMHMYQSAPPLGAVLLRSGARLPSGDTAKPPDPAPRHVSVPACHRSARSPYTLLVLVSTVFLPQKGPVSKNEILFTFQASCWLPFSTEGEVDGRDKATTQGVRKGYWRHRRHFPSSCRV